MSTTPLMGMTLPTVGVTSGSDGNNQYIAAFNVIDSHDHTSGKGTQVPSGGLNINADLSFNSHSQTNVRNTKFSTQGVAFSSSSDNYSVYVVGNELYFRDGAGNNVAITSSGSVAGSSGSIGGLSSPASASFSSPTFIWKSDATTFAKMRHADIELYHTTAGATTAITLKASTSLAASYTMTLPLAVPGSTQYMSMDNTGALSTVSANTLVDTVTRSTGTTVSHLGVAISSSSSTFTTASTTYVDVTNLSVTITTSGRPVAIALVADGSANTTKIGPECTFAGNTNAGADNKVVRDSTDVSIYEVIVSAASAQPKVYVKPGIIHIDAVGAGTYTYKMQTKCTSTNMLSHFEYVKLVAYEL